MTFAGLVCYNRMYKYTYILQIYFERNVSVMKTKRILAFILLFCCVLTGCNSSNSREEATSDSTTSNSETTATEPEGTTSGDPDPDGTTPPPQDEDPVPPVTMKLTHVTIEAGDSPAEQTALSELTKYLEMRSITVGEGGYPIDLYIDVSMYEDSYCVEAVIEGNRPGMDIRGGNGRGVLYGVYGFLEKYAGLRAFTPTLEVYPTEGDIVIEEGKMIEFYPVFEMRVNDWYRWAAGPETYSWCVKNGVNMIDGWWEPWDKGDGSLGGAWDYGGLFVHTIGGLTETGGGTSANPCLTNPDNLEKAIKNVRARLESRPSTTIISVSQNDTDVRCHCYNCTLIDQVEGSPAGTLLRFVNAIAENIAEDYPNVIIDTLAYDYTQTAPKRTKPAENVCIRLCTFHCHFVHPLNDPNCEANAKFCRDLEAWSKICDNIHIWDYTTNFAYYIPTYANLHVLQANMQFFAEHNARGMFPQGNRNSPSGEFGELRAYLLAKLMMNPYMTEEEYYALMDEFLEAYYGDGWAFIRMYIDKTSEIFEDYCGNMYMHPLNRIPAEEFIAQQQSFTDWWDKAEDMADESLKDNVHRSSLQWRWFLARFDKTQQPAFEQAVRDYGIYWSEGNPNNTRW